MWTFTTKQIVYVSRKLLFHSWKFVSKVVYKVVSRHEKVKVFFSFSGGFYCIKNRFKMKKDTWE